MSGAVLREHRPLLLLVGVALVASAVAERLAGLEGLTLRSVGYWPTYWLFLVPAAVPVPLFLGRCLWEGARERAAGKASPGSPLALAWRRARHGPLARERALGALLGTLCIGVVINVFSSWKLAIPRVQPFAWDLELHRLDVALHGGRMPWEWLQPLVGRVAATRFLDAVYLLWHPVVGLGAAVLVWSSDRRLRMQFLLTFVLAWFLLGAGMAMAFSSAGPCYWAGVVGLPNPYAGLFEYLRATDGLAPLAALRIQDGLWAKYTAQAGVAYSGISAMPSMHVAIPVIFAMAALGRRTRWLAVAASAFALLTLAGSIHLGWHYAVDGYAGIAGIVLLWWVVGRVVARAVKPGESARSTA